MGYLSGLFLLLFKISLIFQGQVDLFTETVQENIKGISSAHGEGKEAVHSIASAIEQIASILPTVEVEERSEVESDDTSHHLSIHRLEREEKGKAKRLSLIFGTKALRGSLLPLYDFFHSWKFHLC
jgi:Fe-S oxidoreductase